MASSKQVFDFLEIIADIVYAIAKLMRSGKDEDVRKILGKDAQTTLVKIRTELEALQKFKDAP